MRPILRRKLLWIWLVVTLVVSMSILSEPVSAAPAELIAPTLVDTTKTPGSTVSIDITVAEVEKLMLYQFVLYYNTTLLTATGHTSYSPFTVKAYEKTNDTAGYISLIYQMPIGEKVGFSTMDPKPVAKIDFLVDDLGISRLNLTKTVLGSVDPDAPVITHTVYDGLFANIELPLHDIAITNITFSPTEVTINESVTITVTVENQGEFEENFNITAYYDSEPIETQTGVTLSVGANTTRTFTWRANVDKGTYKIKATAGPVTGGAGPMPDETDTADNTRTAVDELIVSAGGQGVPLIVYAGGGIAAIIVIAIVVFALRKRKPKPA